MLLQVGHEGGTAGSHGRGVAGMGLMLAVDITVGIADVDLAELGQELDAGAVGGPEIGMAEFPIAQVAGKQRPTTVVGRVLQRLQECTMAGRHVVSHLLKVDRQGIWGMGDAEPCIEAGHDGALRAGFAAELLRLPSVGRDTLIHEPVRE